MYLEHFIYHNWEVVAGSLLLIISILAYWLYTSDFVSTHVVRIAASDRFDDSYIAAQILANHVNTHSKSLYVELIETQGSKANSRLLLEHKVDFAFVHYDPQLVGTAYCIATMFNDVVQLLSRPGSGVNTIDDLRGKRVALASNDGIENEIFDLIIRHYSIEKSSMHIFQTSWRGASWSLTHDLVDVVFRVKTVANDEVMKLISHTNANFLGIDQAKAMNVKYPNLNVAEIPIGMFAGSPAVPHENVETVGINRYLVAASWVNPELVKELTRILFEEREYLILRSPLFEFTTMPDANCIIPVHEGSSSYFLREQPSFWQQNADLLALVVTLVAIVVSVFINLKNQTRRKRVNDYNRKLLALRLKIDNASDHLQLKQLREELNGFIGRVVEDAVLSRITSDGFEFFAFTWENVRSLLEDKEVELNSLTRE
jgi:TRAP transporter TAXI family solute receptor